MEMDRFFSEIDGQLSLNINDRYVNLFASQKYLNHFEHVLSIEPCSILMHRPEKNDWMTSYLENRMIHMKTKRECSEYKEKWI